MTVKAKAASVFTGALLAPRALWACATCFGQGSNVEAAGLSWAIFVLMGTIVAVLVVLARFFLTLRRRERELLQHPNPPRSSSPSLRVG